MVNKRNTLWPAWEKISEIFSPEQGIEEHFDIEDLIADFLLLGEYYYYVFDVLDQRLHSQHPNILKVHGLKDYPQTLQQVIDLVHPDDISFVLRAEEVAHRYILKAGLQHMQSLKCCYCFRMRIADGTYHLFHHQSVPVVVDSAFRVVKSLNVHTDIDDITPVNNRTVTVLGINGRPDFYQIQLKERKRATKNTHPLTSRELDVLRYIVNGYSSVEIAAALGITPNTCRVHRKNIFRKMGCHNATSLVKKAKEMGVL
jgi:Response regulator containing a CheY-like receiver domain and an HTH DNA-binding domain